MSMENQQRADRVRGALLLAGLWRAQIARLVGNQSFPKDNRKSLAASFLHASIEHYYSICLLVETGYPGSAAALFRPQLEATYRALWISLIADDKEIQKFLDGHNNIPKLYEIAEQIDTHEDFKVPMFRELQKGLSPYMNDYVHGGKRQILSRIQRDELQVHMSSDDQIDLIFGSSKLSVMTTSYLGLLCGPPNLWKEITDAHTAIFGE